MSAASGKRRLGVIGTFVWDVIYGRDPRELPVEEWGGITYSLSGLDAALADDWEIVPLMKVGSDLIDRAREFTKHARAYIDAKGVNAALAEEWLKAISSV